MIRRELAVAFGVVLTVTLLAVWLSYCQVSFSFLLKPYLEHKKMRGNWSVAGPLLLSSIYSKATSSIKSTKTNKILISPNDMKYSNLSVTYERMFLPENDSLDVFISVRTTSSLHGSRLMLLLQTWLQTVDPKQVHCP